MSLAPEDSLRLNVMLVNVLAVRIDEGVKQVHGLMKDGRESCIQLSPNCRADLYVKKVRELLSSNVLGSPGGYPVFLKRWTRMGQASDASLENLLLLGEPEAVVAVTGAAGLTNELASRAWWIMPDADNARRMLRNGQIAQGSMGKILAEFLLEFLPFEQQPKALIDSVALILQSGLLQPEAKHELWQKGRQKSIFRIGFLKTLPDDLPETPAEREVAPSVRMPLMDLVKQGNLIAQLLARLWSSQGQGFINTCLTVLDNLSSQEAAVALWEAVENYFLLKHLPLVLGNTYHEIETQVDEWLGANELAPDLAAVRKCCPMLLNELRSLLVLSLTSSKILDGIFSHTNAVGSVMRHKIRPVSIPLRTHLNILLGKVPP